MKSPKLLKEVKAEMSHPVRGAWIEMVGKLLLYLVAPSHPVRGAWIEMVSVMPKISVLVGRTPSGVRGLKYSSAVRIFDWFKSHPVRGAWIEILI